MTMDLSASTASNVTSLKRALDDSPPVEETTQKRAKTPVPATARPTLRQSRMAIQNIIYDHDQAKNFPRILKDADHWTELLRSPASDNLQVLLGKYAISEEESIETRLGRDTVTVILVKVKNTSRAQTVHFSAELLQIFDDIPTSAPVPKDIPYFVIVFNLGVAPARASPLSEATPASTAKLTSHRLTIGNRKTIHPDDPPLNGHSCYWIEVRVCSSEVLNPKISQHSALHDILATRLVFHEVKQEEHEDILRFKPTFMQDSQCFSWAQDSNTSRPTPGFDDEDMEDVLIMED